MKMLPDDKGYTLNLNAGEPQRLEFSFDMSQTFMEDINDLEVAIWLQNYETHEIYNSRYAYEYTEHCYPIQNMEAIEILDCTGALNITWNAPEQGNPVGYNVYLDGELIAEHDAEDLSYYTEDPEIIEDILRDGRTHIAEVVALYENGKTSVSVAKVIRGIVVNVNENQEINCYIYPNPAKDFVKISGENIKSVNIYNCIGMNIYSIECSINNAELMINVEDFKSGIYFINITTGSNEIVKKLIKK